MNSAVTSWYFQPTIRTAIRNIPTPLKAFSNSRYRTTTNEKSFGTTARAFTAPLNSSRVLVRYANSHGNFNHKSGGPMETQTATAAQTKTSDENAKDRFIRKTRELFAKEADLDKRWIALRPILAELLADPEMVAASKKWPDCVPANGRAENLLFYEDADFGFAINGLVKGRARQGAPARIHDHAHIYTLYGVIDGHEKVVRYDRIDDRSRTNFAQIKESSNVLCGPGEIDLVKPYEVHTEITVGERTVAVIIRSQKGGEFNQGRYVPEENRYYESLGPRQTRCEMLPKY